MSLLAGFDCVIEMSADQVGQLVTGFLGNNLGGYPISESIPDLAGGTYNIQLNCPITVTLQQDPVFTIAIPCSVNYISSSVTLPTQNGTLTISNLQFDPVQSNGTMAVFVKGLTAEIVLDSNTALQGQLNDLLPLAQAYLVNLLGTQPTIQLPGISINAQANGSISQNGMVFTHLENHNTSAGGVSALTFFGNFFTTSAVGDWTQHDTSSLAAGGDFAINISLNTFNSLLFCPGIALPSPAGLGAMPPGSCGGGAPLTVKGVTITNLSTSFQGPGSLPPGLTGTAPNGALLISGSATATQDCVTGDCNLSGAVLPTMPGGTLTLTPTFATPHVNTSLNGGWCIVGVVVVGLALAPLMGGVFAAITAILAAGLTTSIVSSVESGMAAKFLSGLTAQPAPSIQDLTVTTASFSAEAFSVVGRLQVPGVTDPPAPQVFLNGSVLSSVVSSTSAYPPSKWVPNYTSPLLDVKKLMVQQTASYTASGENVPAGAQLKIWLLARGQRYDIADGQTVSLIVDAAQPFGPHGATAMISKVSLIVSLKLHSDGSLAVSLQANPADGNYDFEIVAAAETTIQGQIANVAVASVTVSIDGEQYQYPPALTVSYAFSIDELLASLRKSVLNYSPFQRPRFYNPPVDDPELADLQNLVFDILTSGSPDAVDLAQSVVALHGVSAARAMRAKTIEAPAIRDAYGVIATIQK